MKKYLQEVWNLLNAGWIKGMFAGKKNEYTDTDPINYQAQDSDSKEADCYCLVGACRKIARAHSVPYGDFLVALNAQLPEDHFPFRSAENRIINYNDGVLTKKEDVLKLIQAAIDHDAVSQAPETM